MSPALPITYDSIDVDFDLRDQGGISSWLKQITEAEGCFLGRLSYHFCSDDYLLEMNQTHLSHDFYTDVITFDTSRLPLVSGEVFISIDRVRENALELKQAFEPELLRVMAHGLLHLIGYGDKTDEEIEMMRAKEKWALKLAH